MLVALQGVAPYLLQRLAAGGDPTPTTPSRAAQQVPRSTAFPRQAARWLLQHGPLLLRIHVALFYLFGTYYHWEKRVTGALMLPYHHGW